MNTSIGKYLFFILCFIFWLFLALFSSKLIVDNLTSGHHYSNALFNLHYLKNTGAAFSLLQNAREFFNHCFYCCDNSVMFICSQQHQRNTFNLGFFYFTTMCRNNEQLPRKNCSWFCQRLYSVKFYKLPDI